MIAIRLPRDIEDRLWALAKRTGRSVDDHAREAILQNLDNLEDIEVAERRLGALHRGESDAAPLSDPSVRHGAGH